MRHVLQMESAVIAKEERDPERDELLSFITYRISQVHPKLNAQATHILQSHAGLSLLQWRSIALLKVHGPAVPSVQLIKFTGMDKGLFSRTLKTLLAEELVSGETDPKDQRKLLLSLTDKGLEHYEHMIEIMRRRQRYLLHDLSDEERRVLYSALDKLEKNSQRRDF